MSRTIKVLYLTEFPRSVSILVKAQTKMMQNEFATILSSLFNTVFILLIDTIYISDIAFHHYETYQSIWALLVLNKWIAFDNTIIDYVNVKCNVYKSNFRHFLCVLGVIGHSSICKIKTRCNVSNLLSRI